MDFFQYAPTLRPAINSLPINLNFDNIITKFQLSTQEAMQRGPMGIFTSIPFLGQIAQSQAFLSLNNVFNTMYQVGNTLNQIKSLMEQSNMFLQNIMFSSNKISVLQQQANQLMTLSIGIGPNINASPMGLAINMGLAFTQPLIASMSNFASSVAGFMYQLGFNPAVVERLETAMLHPLVNQRFIADLYQLRISNRLVGDIITTPMQYSRFASLGELYSSLNIYTTTNWGLISSAKLGEFIRDITAEARSVAREIRTTSTAVMGLYNQLVSMGFSLPQSRNLIREINFLGIGGTIQDFTQNILSSYNVLRGFGFGPQFAVIPSLLAQISAPANPIQQQLFAQSISQALGYIGQPLSTFGALSLINPQNNYISTLLSGANQYANLNLFAPITSFLLQQFVNPMALSNLLLQPINFYTTSIFGNQYANLPLHQLSALVNMGIPTEVALRTIYALRNANTLNMLNQIIANNNTYNQLSAILNQPSMFERMTPFFAQVISSMGQTFDLTPIISAIGFMATVSAFGRFFDAFVGKGFVGNILTNASQFFGNIEQRFLAQQGNFRNLVGNLAGMMRVMSDDLISIIYPTKEALYRNVGRFTGAFLRSFGPGIVGLGAQALATALGQYGMSLGPQDTTMGILSLVSGISSTMLPILPLLGVSLFSLPMLLTFGLTISPLIYAGISHLLGRRQIEINTLPSALASYYLSPEYLSMASRNIGDYKMRSFLEYMADLSAGRKVSIANLQNVQNILSSNEFTQFATAFILPYLRFNENDTRRQQAFNVFNNVLTGIINSYYGDIQKMDETSRLSLAMTFTKELSKMGLDTAETRKAIANAFSISSIQNIIRNKRELNDLIYNIIKSNRKHSIRELKAMAESIGINHSLLIKELLNLGAENLIDFGSIKSLADIKETPELINTEEVRKTMEKRIENIAKSLSRFGIKDIKVKSAEQLLNVIQMLEDTGKMSSSEAKELSNEIRIYQALRTFQEGGVSNIAVPQDADSLMVEFAKYVNELAKEVSKMKKS